MGYAAARRAPAPSRSRPKARAGAAEEVNGSVRRMHAPSPPSPAGTIVAKGARGDETGGAASRPALPEASAPAGTVVGKGVKDIETGEGISRPAPAAAPAPAEGNGDVVAGPVQAVRTVAPAPTTSPATDQRKTQVAMATEALPALGQKFRGGRSQIDAGWADRTFGVARGRRAQDVAGRWMRDWSGDGFWGFD
ncbi:hypothetical protein LCGC14_2775130, partial [marine sediment metagenome]